MVTGHFRLEAKIIGRKAKDRSGHPIPGRQSSVVAKAAYRSGQMLHDERAEKTFNYRSRTQEVAYSEILAPEIAPDWLKGESPASNAGTRKQRDMREQLWNTIERVEKRSDSQLAREFIASLPRGLNREQQIELVRGWCQSEFTSKGLVVDLAVHKSKGGKNPHAHILRTMRRWWRGLGPGLGWAWESDILRFGIGRFCVADINNLPSQKWLSDMDSNHDKSLQRALCYRYTIGQ